jgi:general secretion pathway protein M
VLAVTLWLGLVQPLLGGFIARADERASLTERYSRNRQLLSSISTWRNQYEQQKSTEQKYYIPATTQALAAETLKSRLDGLISARGGEVRTVEEMNGNEAAGWVRVRSDFDIDLPQLTKCLEQLETEEPYVTVEYLSITADRAFQTGHLAGMAVRLEVSAPFRVPGSR